MKYSAQRKGLEHILSSFSNASETQLLMRLQGTILANLQHYWFMLLLTLFAQEHTTNKSYISGHYMNQR